MLKNYIDVYESHNLNNGLCHYRTFSFHWPSNPYNVVSTVRNERYFPDPSLRLLRQT